MGAIERQVGVRDSERQLRTGVSYSDFMREGFGNVALPVKDDLMSTPSMIAEELTAPVIEYFGSLNSFVRPSQLLLLTRPSRMHRYMLMLRHLGGYELASLHPDSTAARDARESADIDLFVDESVAEVAEEIDSEFGPKFLPWYGTSLIGRHEVGGWTMSRWVTRPEVFFSDLVGRFSEVGKSWPCWTARPVVVDIMRGKIREILDCIELRYGVPLDRDLQRTHTIFTIFASQLPQTEIERLCDKRSGTSVSNWEQVKGRLGSRGEIDLREAVEVLQGPIEITRGFGGNGVETLEAVLRIGQYAIQQWDVPMTGRTESRLIDRYDPPITRGSLELMRGLLDEREIGENLGPRLHTDDIRRRAMFATIENPYLLAWFLGKTGAYRKFTHLGHNSEQKWDEFVRSLPACTQEIGGPPEHRYHTAYHRPGRLYLGFSKQTNYPKDFVPGWRVMAAGMRMNGIVKPEIAAIDNDLEMLTRVYEVA